VRITLNLASRPFADAGPAIRRLRIALAVLAVVAIALGLGLHALDNQAKQARAREHVLDAQIASLNSQRQGYVNLMQQPDNAQLLKQSAALNTLFDEKSFSWTLTMEDLETALPAGVQVSTLEPIIDKSHNITMHLRVLGPRDSAIDFVRNLEHSRRFRVSRIVGETAEGATTGAGQMNRFEPVSASSRVSFDVLANYIPPHSRRNPRPQESRIGQRCFISSPQTRPRTRSLYRLVLAAPRQRRALPRAAQAQYLATSRQPKSGRPAMNPSTSQSASVRERLTAPLTWHIVACAALSILVLVLGIRLGMDWAATNTRSSSALEQKQIQAKALVHQNAPLAGLDKRVDDSRKQIAAFYAKRIPANYSSIAHTFGDLGIKSGVRLSSVQYTQGQAGADLTEITLDAGIAGAYPQIMRFVNSLESDQTFFIVRGMALTGQQGGLVNLRLRVSTWLRPDDVPNGLPPTPPESEPSDAASASKSAKEVD
jgi:Tfp pilus assembly protein PilN